MALGDADSTAVSARLRDRGTVFLGIVCFLPLIVNVPPWLNILTTATVTVSVACLRSSGDSHEAQLLSKQEAIKFPLIGSLSLVALFLAVRFVPKEYLSYIVTFYFCVMGVLAIGEFLYSMLERYFPSGLMQRQIVKLEKVKIPLIMDNAEDVTVTPAWILAASGGILCSLFYAATKHFIPNNLLALAYSVEGIAMLNLGSTQVGVLLLSGLFVYDIFWVFFTPVMVTVAKNIDGPIKLLFPVPGLKQYSMLGLGDIVIPGLFVRLMLSFDLKRGTSMPYFTTAVGGYALGLGATVFVMNYFKAAQPALLYIVPSLFVSTSLLALYRGAFRELWSFEAESPHALDGASSLEATQELERPVEEGPGDEGDKGKKDL